MAEEAEGAGEHAAGGLKGLLTHKLGPLPAWVWGLGLIGTYLVYRYYKNAAANSPQAQSGTLAVNPALSAGSGGGGNAPSPDYSTAINGLLSDVQAQQASLTNQGNALGSIQAALQQEQQAFSELQAGSAPQTTLQPYTPPPSIPLLPAPIPAPTFAPYAQNAPIAPTGGGYFPSPAELNYEAVAARNTLQLPQPVYSAPGSIPFPNGPLVGLPSGIYGVQSGPLPFIPAPPAPTSFPQGTTIGPPMQGNTGQGAYVTLPNGEQIWQPYGSPPVI